MTATEELVAEVMRRPGPDFDPGERTTVVLYDPTRNALDGRSWRDFFVEKLRDLSGPLDFAYAPSGLRILVSGFRKDYHPWELAGMVRLS